MTPPSDGEDGTLFEAARTTTRSGHPPRPRRPARDRPVARVLVSTPLPHLDRPFDYLVPEEFDEAAVEGCRVRVHFNGRRQSGFLLRRCEHSEHTGRLSYLQQVVSSEVVLSSEIADLARAVAERYAGTRADVLRLAIPPRHARVEREPVSQPVQGPAPPPRVGPWAEYPDGPALLEALRSGEAPRRVWGAVPGSGRWCEEVALAAAATRVSGRGCVIVLPDGRDVAEVDAALHAELRPGDHVALTADLGPAERYRRWLAAARGRARVVVGTRAAMFAPVTDLGLVVLWDDGDDVHAEPHAPYPHARTVLGLRAHLTGCAALIGGWGATAESAALVRSGWAAPLHAPRHVLRRRAPRVTVSGDDAEQARDPAARTARLPSVALRVAREALLEGPVLVQVPRRGYLDSVACSRCRTPARCDACHGPLTLPGAQDAPRCRWCGRMAVQWNCGHCGGGRLRGVAIGARRTAEELGRALASVPVRTSGREEVLQRVSGEPALVVATPGAEPRADGGFRAALLLDGWVLLGRADLRAAEEALRRWTNAAALVRAAEDGGRVVVVADSPLPAVQALVRWDPAGFAERELAERSELGFPPAVGMASVTGEAEAVRDFLSDLRAPDLCERLGPVPLLGRSEGTPQRERVLLRVPRGATRELAVTLRAAAAARSARRDEHRVQVRMDPLDIA